MNLRYLVSRNKREGRRRQYAQWTIGPDGNYKYAGCPFSRIGEFP